MTGDIFLNIMSNYPTPSEIKKLKKLSFLNTKLLRCEQDNQLQKGVRLSHLLNAKQITKNN